MQTFKEFTYNQEQEAIIKKLAKTIAMQLKASQTPILTSSITGGSQPVNYYHVPSNEVSKRLGLMEKKYIPWLMQAGILLNDPMQTNAHQGDWLINADRLKEINNNVGGLFDNILNNKYYRFSNFVANQLFNQMNRSNPSSTLPFLK